MSDEKPTRITKYEYCKVIGIRVEQLARSAPPLVMLTDRMMRNNIYDIKLIAEAEYAAGVLPFEIVRKTPVSNKHVKLYLDD